MTTQVEAMAAHAQKGQTLSEAFEQFHRVSEQRGTVFGYAFGFKTVIAGGTGVWAWCQYSRETKHGFENFGKVQPSQKFDTIEQARAWFKRTMAERIKANREKWTRDGHRVVGLK